MATIEQTPEPTLLDVSESWAKSTFRRIKDTFLASARSWIMLVFAALVLSIVQLPYPLTIAMLLLVYRMQEQQDWQDRLRKVEEAVAWGMRRGNWQS